MKILKIYYLITILLILHNIILEVLRYNGLLGYEYETFGYSLTGMAYMLFGLSGIVLSSLSVLITVYITISKKTNNKLLDLTFSILILLLGIAWTTFLLIQMNIEDHGGRSFVKVV